MALQAGTICSFIVLRRRWIELSLRDAPGVILARHGYRTQLSVLGSYRFSWCRLDVKCDPRGRPSSALLATRQLREQGREQHPALPVWEVQSAVRPAVGRSGAAPGVPSERRVMSLQNLEFIFYLRNRFIQSLLIFPYCGFLAK